MDLPKKKPDSSAIDNFKALVVSSANPVYH